MNIARNHTFPPTGDAPIRAEDAFADLPPEHRHIDWQALRTRLFASRDTLASPEADYAATRLPLRGSFDDDAALRLGVYQTSLRPVNPAASSNGKSVEVTKGSVADAHGNGERG
jgi:hypothetical protein